MKNLLVVSCQGRAEIQQVLECASPLALLHSGWTVNARKLGLAHLSAFWEKSGRGLPQSKTLRVPAYDSKCPNPSVGPDKLETKCAFLEPLPFGNESANLIRDLFRKLAHPKFFEIRSHVTTVSNRPPRSNGQRTTHNKPTNK